MNCCSSVQTSPALVKTLAVGICSEAVLKQVFLKLLHDDNLYQALRAQLIPVLVTDPFSRSHESLRKKKKPNESSILSF